MSKKFDVIYESILSSLRESDEAPQDPDYASYVANLVGALIDARYIQTKSGQAPSDEDQKTIISHALETNEINLDALGLLSKSLPFHNSMLPPVVLQLNKQDGFGVTVVDTSKPANDPKRTQEFSGIPDETVYKNVTDALKLISVQKAAPETAVETLPPSTGANAQPAGETTPAPEAGESALPGV